MNRNLSSSECKRWVRIQCCQNLIVSSQCWSLSQCTPSMTYSRKNNSTRQCVKSHNCMLTAICLTTLLQYITVTILNAEKPNLNSWSVLATLSKFFVIVIFRFSRQSCTANTSLSPNIKVNKLLLNRMQHNWLKSQISSQE